MLRSSFNSTETFTLSKIQQGLLLHSQLSEKNQFYISQIRIEIEDTVDCELLQKCCQLAVDKHAILRASISTKDLQQATLLIHDDIKVRINLVDISHYSDVKRGQILESILNEDFFKKIDITKAPLMRWTLIKLSRSKHIFLWTHHHVLLSGNEIAKVLKEIFEYYDGGGINKSSSDTSHNYSQYLNILKKYNYPQTRKYWQRLLRGYEPKELLLTKKK